MRIRSSRTNTAPRAECAHAALATCVRVCKMQGCHALAGHKDRWRCVQQSVCSLNSNIGIGDGSWHCVGKVRLCAYGVSGSRGFGRLVAVAGSQSRMNSVGRVVWLCRCFVVGLEVCCSSGFLCLFLHKVAFDFPESFIPARCRFTVPERASLLVV